MSPYDGVPTSTKCDSATLLILEPTLSRGTVALSYLVEVVIPQGTTLLRLVFSILEVMSPSHGVTIST
jgi:hypothetical protein